MGLGSFFKKITKKTNQVTKKILKVSPAGMIVAGTAGVALSAYNRMNRPKSFVEQPAYSQPLIVNEQQAVVVMPSNTSVPTYTEMGSTAGRVQESTVADSTMRTKEPCQVSVHLQKMLNDADGFIQKRRHLREQYTNVGTSNPHRQCALSASARGLASSDSSYGSSQCPDLNSVQSKMNFATELYYREVNQLAHEPACTALLSEFGEQGSGSQVAYSEQPTPKNNEYGPIKGVQ